MKVKDDDEVVYIGWMLTDETRWLSLYLLFALHSDKTGPMNLRYKKTFRSQTKLREEQVTGLSLIGGSVPDSPETSSEAVSETWTDASGTSEDVGIRCVWFLHWGTSARSFSATLLFSDILPYILQQNVAA